MSERKKLAGVGLLLLVLRLLAPAGGGAADRLGAWVSPAQLLSASMRMELGLSPSGPAGKPSPPPPVPVAVPAPAPPPAPAPAEAAPEETAPVMTAGGIPIRTTTIPGGLILKNQTDFGIDLAGFIREGTAIRLPADEPQILILHTHSSEAYTPAGTDQYEASDTDRTQDERFNIIRVGDELTRLFEEAGLHVIHDRGVYDYPSYTGCYARSGAAAASYLEAHPSIRIVIDVHRDALCSDDVVYKTMAEIPDTPCSQLMLLVGTDGSGLTHPHWRDNLHLAAYLQNAVDAEHPTLMRPITLVNERYNQHLTAGSILLEVGSNGNTLQEALAAVRLFGESAGPALAKLVS